MADRTSRKNDYSAGNRASCAAVTPRTNAFRCGLFARAFAGGREQNNQADRKKNAQRRRRRSRNTRDQIADKGTVMTTGPV
jgi:hypothetical protein